ncbi:MAG: ABC transporter ATP-binding protein [Promethearchaeota archaeon]
MRKDTDYIIETFNLTKKYRIKGKKNELVALNDINLKVKKGEIFGLLGPNGAGKTTMVSILTTLIQPTSGTAKIFGRDILKWNRFVKENVGLMLGGDMIYYRLTGYRNLNFFCKLYNIKDPKSKIENIADLLNLTDWLNQYVENYSTGMKVKLALARVLLIEPKILFLDEPMLGLDPNIIQDLIQILIDLKKTIFLTSHHMDVVQSLCDRIAFLKNGELLKVDTQENFKKLITEEIRIQIEISNLKKNELIESFSTVNFISDVVTDKNNMTFSLKNKNSYSKLFEILKEHPITQIKELEPDLNDVFIKLSH